MSHLGDGVLREAVIDASAITANTRQLRRMVGVDVMAVVKRAVEAVAAASPRVSLVLKADIRPGYTGQLTAKVERIERELGADGIVLVHEVLVLGMTMEQVGQRRGLRGQRWKDYFARRFQECLDRLALIYGFATGATVQTSASSVPRVRRADF